MAPSEEDLEMTPRDSRVLEETSPHVSLRTRARTDASVTAHDGEDSGADELDGTLIADPGTANEFVARRTTVQNMLDLALFAANIAQLRVILTIGPGQLDFYHLLRSCVCLSLGCQVLFAIIILAVKIREDQLDPVSRDPELTPVSKRLRRDRVTDILNYISMVLVLMLLFLNMVISGFVTVKKDSPSELIVQT